MEKIETELASSNTPANSSIISAYINRFRYSRPTAPEERNLPTKREAFWWLNDDNQSTIESETITNTSTRLADLSTNSEDSLDQRDHTQLPRKIDKPAKRDNDNSLMLSHESVDSSIDPSIFSRPSVISESIPNMLQSVDSATSLDLHSQEEELPRSYYHYPTPHITTNHSKKHSSYSKGIVEYGDDMKSSTEINQDEQEAEEDELDIPTAEEELEIDEHMKQILRQCNRLVKSYKQDTARLKTTTAASRADSPPPPPPPPLPLPLPVYHNKPSQLPTSNKQTRQEEKKLSTSSKGAKQPSPEKQSLPSKTVSVSEKPPGVAEALSLVQRILRDTNNLDLLSVRESVESNEAEEEEEEEEEDDDEEEVVDKESTVKHRQQGRTKNNEEDDVLSSLESSVFDRYLPSPSKPLDKETTGTPSAAKQSTTISSITSPNRHDEAHYNAHSKPPLIQSPIRPRPRETTSDDLMLASPIDSISPVRSTQQTSSSSSAKKKTPVWKDEDDDGRHSHSPEQSPSILYLSSDDEDEMINDLVQYLPSQASPFVAMDKQKDTSSLQGVAFALSESIPVVDKNGVKDAAVKQSAFTGHDVQLNTQAPTTGQHSQSTQQTKRMEPSVIIDHDFVKGYLNDEVVAQLWNRLVEVRKNIKKAK